MGLTETENGCCRPSGGWVDWYGDRTARLSPFLRHNHYALFWFSCQPMDPISFGGFGIAVAAGGLRVGMTNALFYGDNLGYLREMGGEIVDLIYLDPPFNSKANYNLLFRSPQGNAVQAQTTAFKDTWRWDQPAEVAFDEVLTSGSRAAPILRALRTFLGESDLMAYLAMMTPRLIELHRVLKETGSLYLHCDPTG